MMYKLYNLSQLSKIFNHSQMRTLSNNPFVCRGEENDQVQSLISLKLLKYSKKIFLKERKVKIKLLTKD